MTGRRENGDRQKGSSYHSEAKRQGSLAQWRQERGERGYIKSIRGNPDGLGDDQTRDPRGLACVHEGPFSEMDDASGGHGLGLDMRSLLLGPQKLRGV